MKSTSNARERILTYGGPGAGKSYGWTDIALWEGRTGDHRVFVVNTDPGRVDRARDQLKLDNVESEDCFGFEQMRANLQKYREQAGRDDWLVLDMVDLLYDWSQDFFLEEVLAQDGTSASDFMLQYRKQSESNPITEQGGWGINWQIVKRLYRDAMSNIHKFPGHVYVASPAEAIRQPDRQGRGGDDKDTMSIFGRFNVKPAGEKRIGHTFPTVLLLAMQGDKWLMNTARDNNRELMRGKSLEAGFAQSYLVDTAGWEM